MPSRKYPIGAEVTREGNVDFRVWAHAHQEVCVVAATDPERAYPLSREQAGYFSIQLPLDAVGPHYRFRLDGMDFPDPASRFQPEGPHGPSQVINSFAFPWSDQKWKGVPRDHQVLYELHIGTMGGTWKEAEKWLSHLSQLGVTTLEVMPVADFPGSHGWGYDGVSIFAPSHLYGTPDDFRHFINEAHSFGLGVILDVVYNHLGPDGNYLKKYSSTYFSDHYKNEWGEALNFDGPGSSGVRDFFIANAAYWIEEFHLDGLRLDATQQIFDSSPMHILAEITRAVRNAAPDRHTYLVAESEAQDTRLIRSVEDGGFGLDAMWNDDFHHAAIVALGGKNEAYYTDYRGTPQEFISSAKYGTLYQGQYCTWQQQSRGTPAKGLPPARFVTFIQNHDQIANSLRGKRIHEISSPGALRVMTALFLLGPGTPMLFQGQEFAASTPFLYFADHHPELAQLVSEGRRTFLMQFPSFAYAEASELLFDPEKPETYEKCRLKIEEVAGDNETLTLYRDLIAIRRNDPVIWGADRDSLDGAVLGEESFLLRYFSATGDRLLLFNFGKEKELSPMPEPLLAPPSGAIWKETWCSENIRYGGEGTSPFEPGQIWNLPARTAVLFRSN